MGVGNFINKGYGAKKKVGGGGMEWNNIRLLDNKPED